TLPSASFRFLVAKDTLAVQLMVPTTKPIADFHRQVTAHVGRTGKGLQYYRPFPTHSEISIKPESVQFVFPPGHVQ
ncbi:MAG: hypothetical protein ACOYIF_07840, partial [Acetivibrionales bacterium]